MKNIKFKMSIILISVMLISCINEIAPPTTEKEIISEISRTWNCSMLEDDFPVEYSIVISNDNSDEKQIFISNFNRIGTSKKVKAKVNKDLSIVITEQTIDQQTFKGSGEISNDYSRITWNYTIEDSNEIINVTGTSTRGNGL